MTDVQVSNARWIGFTALLLLATLLSGCSSYVARTFYSDSFPVIYPGVTLAVYQVIETPESLPPFGLIDISLSLAFDTVLLPIDLIVWPFGGWDAIWGDLFKVH